MANRDRLSSPQVTVDCILSWEITKSVFSTFEKATETSYFENGTEISPGRLTASQVPRLYLLRIRSTWSIPNGDISARLPST